jgi:peptide/nickel transport system permease protein
MIAVIARRLLIAVFLLLIASFFTFGLVQLAPGNYIQQLRLNPQNSDELVDNLVQRYGLEDPLYVQYFRWLSNLARGDMGYSFVHEQPVATLVWERFKNTVFLMFVVIVVTWLLALPMGIYCAVHKNSPLSRALSFIAFIGLSIPNFFLCLLLIYLAAEIGFIPVSGMTSVYFENLVWWEKILDIALHMFIPVIVLSTSAMAGLQRLTRGNMLEVLRKQYIMAARARGLPENRVIYGHALRNALNPLITIFGYQFSWLVSGAALVEIIYGWPGMGQLILEAVQTQDVFLVVGTVLSGGIMLIAGNLLADLLLGWLDPRIRIQEGQSA